MNIKLHLCGSRLEIRGSVNMSETATSPTETLANQHWEAVYNAVDGLGIDNDPSIRANQVSAMTAEGIMEGATTLHTVLAPDMSHEPTDYIMNVTSPDCSNRTPLTPPTERQHIFVEAARLVDEANELRRGGDDLVFLERAANVVALALVLAHPFEDGNGRTARAMAQLTREGYSGSSEERDDIKDYGGNRPVKGFRILSFLPTGDGKLAALAELLAVAASLDVPLRDKQKYAARKQRTYTSPFAY